MIPALAMATAACPDTKPRLPSISVHSRRLVSESGAFNLAGQAEDAVTDATTAIDLQPTDIDTLAQAYFYRELGLAIYPAPTERGVASAQSWVTESRSAMDVIVWREVSAWLADQWPFHNPVYAHRE